MSGAGNIKTEIQDDREEIIVRNVIEDNSIFEQILLELQRIRRQLEYITNEETYDNH
jgi:hypothetical protein